MLCAWRGCARVCRAWLGLAVCVAARRNLARAFSLPCSTLDPVPVLWFAENLRDSPCLSVTCVPACCIVWVSHGGAADCAMLCRVWGAMPGLPGRRCKLRHHIAELSTNKHSHRVSIAFRLRPVMCCSSCPCQVLTCIRQPSQGPTFGIKGGAAGGGYSQVWRKLPNQANYWHTNNVQGLML
eukprot:GHRQ01031061.1.p1 GENE.GHRQ01031061.1~~GHRQ01031061.1.p1  ORF type:complete len:182 (-),score=4.02 GHRQ01031061.1:173-718(-)